MTDEPEGPAVVEQERGARRSPRVGDSGSPVGSTLSIVLAVVAVIAGFFILRAITDDDGGGDAGTVVPATDEPGAGTTPGASSTLPGVTTISPTTTVAVRTTTGATVVVANASGIGGSAAAMTTVLEGAGYTLGTPGNATSEDLTTSIVYYVVGDAVAQAVAASVATDLGGVTIQEMPSPPPIQEGIGTSTVLVMVGSDTANKTLADLNPAAATPPPAAAGVTTTTVAGG